MRTTMDYATSAETEVMEPQNTNTTSVSFEIAEMQIVEDFYELRNNSAFAFWNSPEENLY